MIRLGVAPDEQRATLEGFGFEVSNDWDVTVPTWRARDVTRDRRDRGGRASSARPDPAHDAASPTCARAPLEKEQRLRRVVEDVLVGAGVSEAYTWSLVGSDPNPDAIRLRNPMTSDQEVLRTTIVPGLVEAARTGVDAGADDVALFEIARVYLPSGKQLPDEHWRVAGVVAGGYDVVKGVLETLYAALHLELRVERGSHRRSTRKAAATEAGWLGELHPTLLEGAGRSSSTWTPCSHPCPSGSSTRTCSRSPRCSRTSRSPGRGRRGGALVDAAHEAAGALLREARVFDVYRGEQVGEGRKSVAIHLSFQSPERTLTDDEAAEARARIVAALADRFDAEPEPENVFYDDRPSPRDKVVRCERGSDTEANRSGVSMRRVT